ncbi:hypothetical protein O181_078444 [Austropuccinia psidii MF-1]|uniref:Uncharacterized protein n=1 Tax=Austropuccinia psidii MF-1 TaxID=1389203 RepID=A0A9Q3FGY1_9BASI|nr:hypothetical protein [Austropuccinia psidii MF-1]
MASNLSELLNHPAPIVKRKGFIVFNLLLLGPPGANFATSEKEILLQPTIDFQTILEGGIFGLEAPVDEPPTSDSTYGSSNLTESGIRGSLRCNNTSSSWSHVAGPISHWSGPRGSSSGNHKA